MFKGSGVCRFRVEGFKGSGEDSTGSGFPWFRGKGFRDSENRGSGAQGFRVSRIQRFSGITGAAGQKFEEFGARWASGDLGSSKAHLARNSGWSAKGGASRIGLFGAQLARIFGWGKVQGGCRGRPKFVGGGWQISRWRGGRNKEQTERSTRGEVR